MIRHRGPPSQTWRTFLRNHADAIVAIDLCVVPTLTSECLFAFLVGNGGGQRLAEPRRQLRKPVILSASTRWLPAHFLYGQGNARRPEGIILVAVSLLRGGVSCNKGCIGWTTIP
jgi:hypothetical protein